MGAWGMGSLENDGSQDWLADFGDVGAPAALEILAAVTESKSEGYLDSDIGCAVVALAEVLAAALDNPNDELTDQLAEAVEAHQAALVAIDGIKEQTLQALDAVLAGGEASELYDLWEETDVFDDWMTQMSELKARLDAA